MPELTDIRTTWAEAIRLERHRRRLKQEDVARLTGLDQTTVSKAEGGRGGLNAFQAIARALKVDLLGESS